MVSDTLKTAWQYVVPQLTTSRLFGYLANKPNSPLINSVIKRYITHFGVKMEEALEEDISQYASFNDFFIRRLKPDVRPLSKAPITSPADGLISQMGEITNGRLFQAKGFDYSLNDLLGNSPLADEFIEGRFATIYLSPKDYHRVHMPCDARLKEMLYVPGRLFSVNHLTAKSIPNLFARNERLVVFFDSAFGLMAMVMVGAINVASIATTWQGDIKREKEQRHWIYPNPRCNDLDFVKGQEMGHFKLGSTVILLFAKGQNMQWQSNLSTMSEVRFGQALGLT